ncbi:MAG: ABC transporter substrate-binding protein [Firmicutes bacterium]|nr:ABC transporter substrate-binding protein [Bacillota bacterium]
MNMFRKVVPLRTVVFACFVICAVVFGVNLTVLAKTVTIAQGVDATTLDPHMSHDTPTSVVTGNIFDSLLRRSPTMELEPALAASYRQVNDLTWEFIMQDEITFHNGEIFDAHTAKYSLERLMDPALMSPQASQLRNIESIEVPDSKTLRVKSKTPSPLIPIQVGNVAMLPPLYAEEVGPAAFAQAPVGTGPYRLKEWIKDEKIILQANGDYYRGAPAVQEVVFRPIPETASRIAELRTGAVDLIANVPPHQAASIDALPDLKVRTAPSSRIIFIVLTTTDGGPLADKRVRQALNYAVDKEAIVRALLGGYGYVLASPLPNNAFGFDPTLQSYPYEPEKAKQLLKEAGFQEGFDLIFEAPQGRYLMDKEVAQAVNGYLQDIGIKTQFNVLEWGVFVSKLYQHDGAPMMLLGLGSTTFDADPYLFTQLRSGEISSYYYNPDIDELLDAARSEMDPKQREALYVQVQELAADEAALIPLYQQVDLFGVHNRVIWEPRSDEMILVYDMDVAP